MMDNTQITVAAFHVGAGIFWLECSKCGPITLVNHADTAIVSVQHLNEHGCQILDPPPDQ